MKKPSTPSTPSTPVSSAILQFDKVRHKHLNVTGVAIRDEENTPRGGHVVWVSWDDAQEPPGPVLVDQLEITGHGTVQDVVQWGPGHPTHGMTLREARERKLA